MKAFEIAEATAKRLKLDCIAVLAGNEVIGYRLRTKDKFREWRRFVSVTGQMYGRIFVDEIADRLLDKFSPHLKKKVA